MKMEQHARLTYLLERMAAHTATDAELAELNQLVEANDTAIDDAEAWLQTQETPTLPAYDAQKWTQVADRILAADKLPDEKPVEKVVRMPRKVPVLHRAGWAAAILLLLGTGTWLLERRHHPQTLPLATTAPLPDIAPGRNGAVLTLADGSQVELDSLGNGVVGQQQGTRIVLQQNTLQYKPGAETSDALAYNTVTTPKGRQFQLTLPDGSKVWLNAGSALQFPVAFNGKERNVTLSGEAYFEVAKNAAQPFTVNVAQQLRIAVLGTSFNVNAYTNEQHTYTTLVSGAVRVSQPNASNAGIVLQPGQQALQTGNDLQLAPTADVEKAIAWKNGLFNFDGIGLRAMMRQLERWYDLEVVYEGNVPDVKFFGEMSRSLQLSDVLTGLERSDVHFRLEAGRRLVVLP